MNVVKASWAGLSGGVLLLIAAGCSAGGPEFASSSMRRQAIGPTYCAKELTPEKAYRDLKSAKGVLARIRQDRENLTEEDLMAFLAPFVRGDIHWLSGSYEWTADGPETGEALVKAILGHPKWTGRFEPWLRAAVAWEDRNHSYYNRTALRRALGVKPRTETHDEIWTRAYPPDGTWTDWLKPDVGQMEGRLDWTEHSGSSAADAIGWFKTPPAEPLPFRGRVLCLLKKRVYVNNVKAFSVIFTFASEADLDAAIAVVGDGVDPRLYSDLPNLAFIEGAAIPPCAWLDYRDPENGCYLLSVSPTWIWDRSSWRFLPDSITPCGKKKGKH